MESKSSEKASNLEDNQEFSIIASSQIELIYKETQRIFSYAFSTVENFLGKSAYPYLTQKQQLYPYIVSLGGNPKNKVYKALKESLRAERKIQLHVTVKTAKISHPNYDISNFSNVHCKLWVELGKQFKTTAKDSASNLYWNETFVLEVPNYESDSLHLELWALYPVIVNQVQKIISKENTPHNLSRNYFVGHVVQDIKSLPCNDQDCIWLLKKGARRCYTRGNIQVHIQLSTLKRQNHHLHIYIHLTLLLLCYSKQLDKIQSSRLYKNWLEILPNAALTLIQQHAIQHGITSIEQLLCSWLVASTLKIRKENHISFYFLKYLLEILMINVYENSFEVYLEEALCNSIRKVFEYALDMLRKLHSNFQIKNMQIQDDLFYMLKCIFMICAKMETHYQKPDLYKIVEEEGYHWYLKIISNYKNGLMKNDCYVEKICDILNEIVKSYLRNQITYDDIFISAWAISYTKITLKKLDNVMHHALKPIIGHLKIIVEDSKRKRKVIVSLKMLQLYHSVRNLVHYVLMHCGSERVKYYMEDYTNWFGEDIILEWFLLCDIYTQPYIKRAVLADSMDQINKKLLHSSSILDAILIIDEMVIDVWMKLKWHDQFYTHGALIEAVRSCIFEYIQAILEKIKECNFYSENHQFKISKKLCVALSNVYALFEHIHIIKNKIEGVLKVAKTEYGFTNVNPFVAFESQLLNSISAVYLLTLEQVNKRLKKLTTNLMKVKIGNTFHPDITDELCSYTEYKLEMLYLNLKPELFYILLPHIWITVLENLRDGLKYKGSTALWMRKKTKFGIISQALNELQIIFHCDGYGLSYKQLQNKIYKDLKQSIRK